MFWGDPVLQGLHIGLFIALAAVFVFWVILNRSTMGYEVRAVGLNPEAARYGGMNVAKNYVLVMAVCGLFAGLAGSMDVLGWQFHIATNDIQISQIGFLGIAVALLGRNTAVGTVAAALLFGGLLSGTSQRNLDPSIFEPELAQNLTTIIQGLVVLVVSADVLVLGMLRRARGLVPGRAGRERRATFAASRPGLSARQLRLGRVALGAIAWYITLPPLLVRTPVPSLLLALAAVAAGVAATRAGDAGSGAGRSWPAWPAGSARSLPPSRARPTWRRCSSGRRCSPRRCASRRRCCSARSAASCPSAAASSTSASRA